MAKKDEVKLENGDAGNDKLKALQAAMDKIEKSFGKGSIMKMGDENIEEIEVIPTFVFYKDGQAVGNLVAPESKAKIEAFIKEQVDA